MADDPEISTFAFRPITLTPTSLTLVVGETAPIRSTGGPVKSWTSSNTTVATITDSGNTGIVAGWSAGSATITAKGGPETATASVLVTALDRPIIEPPEPPVIEPPEPVGPPAAPPRVDIA